MSVASLVAQMVKNLPAIQETQLWSVYVYEDKIYDRNKRHFLKYLVKLQFLKIVSMNYFFCFFRRYCIFSKLWEKNIKLIPNLFQVVNGYAFYKEITVNKTDWVQKQRE